MTRNKMVINFKVIFNIHKNLIDFLIIDSILLIKRSNLLYSLGILNKYQDLL